jgi:general secretion pathway protein L
LSTLYIRLPSRAAADSAPDWLDVACPFALVSHGNMIERQGMAPLSDLADTIAKSQRIVLLVAASDVSLLRVKVPPLSSARLKAALPNLVEDQLLADPSDCVIVASGVSEGLRTIAVVQRAWLDNMAKAILSFGARHITALPAQLSLPSQYQSGQTGSTVSAIEGQDNGERGTDIDMTLRFSEQEGIGLTIHVEQNDSAVHEALRTLCALIPEAPITLYVPQSSVRTYQDAVQDAVSLSKRISVFADSWSRWIAGANSNALDLMAGLGLNTRPRLAMHAWRWPMALAATVALINITALNIDWWRIKSEASALRSTMIQIYKSAYPKESVIIDPIAQMQQKIALAKHDSGQAAPDDFTAISAALGEAWAAPTEGKAPGIAAFEYRERSLFVRFKIGGEAPTQQIKTALAKRNLTLELAPAQSGAVVWQIRSAR